MPSFCRLALLVGLSLTTVVCSPSPPADVAKDLPARPLPPCPDTPNCVHETHRFALDPDTLFVRARAALDALGPSRLDLDPDARRIDAVFTVFLFKDDVQIAVAPHEDGAVLHIRSASRVGYSDLGVNRRRVNRFFDALERRL